MVYIKLCEVVSFPACQLLNLRLSIHVKGECDVYLCIYSCIQTLIKTRGLDINTEDLGCLNLGPRNKLIAH